MSNTKIKAGMFYGVVGHGTDGYFLMSNGDGSMTWGQASTGPSVTSVTYPGDDTAADPAGGQTVVLTGTGFATSGMTVTIGGTAAPSVAHTSNTQLTITTPAKAAGDYDIVVTNGVTGASGTFVNGISYNGVPTWTTAAGSLGTFESSTTISTITLQATEPDGGTITFNITNGALPTGLSLSGANINGTTTAETSTTLYSFTIEAIDDENQSTPRNFSITVNAALVNTDAFDIITYTGTGGTYNVGDGQEAGVTVNSGVANYAYTDTYFSSGKKYFEVEYVSANGGANTLMVGIINTAYMESWTNAQTKMYYAGNGYKYTGGTGVSYGSTYAPNDIIGVAYDADNRTVTFYKNGTSQGTAFTGLQTTYPSYRAAIGTGLNSETVQFKFTSSEFTYSIPSGYTAWGTSNVYASGGTVQSAQAGQPIDFQPDLVWVKNRSAVYSNCLVDSVRGASKTLFSDGSYAEDTTAGIYLSSFNSNGFTVGTGNAVSANTNNFVAWCWKAGGAAVSNTDGSITSTVSANQAAGFSIVKWTGDTNTTATVGHGLSAEPELYFLKGLDNGTDSWIVCGNSTIFSSPTTNFLRLNTTDSVGSTATNTVGSNGNVINIGVRNYNGQDTIAYCFHSVDGYQKIGSYTGNDSLTGPTVTTGFRPRFVLIKNVDAAGNSWAIIDGTRSTADPRNKSLFPNASDSEYTNTGGLTFTDTGFEVDSTDNFINGLNHTHIYLAIA